MEPSARVKLGDSFIELTPGTPLPTGKPLEILHHGETVHLSAGKPQVRPIPAAPARPRPRQPPGREPAHRLPSEEPATTKGAAAP